MSKMLSHLHRILAFIAAMAMLLPIGLRAQQSDQQQSDKNQSQTQSDDSSAQSQPDHPRRSRRMRGTRHRQGMGSLAEKLNLTDEQKQQFRQIHQQMMQQARAIHKDSSLSDDQKRDKMQQLRKQSHQQMFSMLTPEQKDQLKQLREQHQKEMQEKNKDKSSGGQASARPVSGNPADDGDPFAGMISDDDDGHEM